MQWWRPRDAERDAGGRGSVDPAGGTRGAQTVTPPEARSSRGPVLRGARGRCIFVVPRLQPPADQSHATHTRPPRRVSRLTRARAAAVTARPARRPRRAPRVHDREFQHRERRRAAEGERRLRDVRAPERGARQRGAAAVALHGEPSRLRVADRARASRSTRRSCFSSRRSCSATGTRRRRAIRRSRFTARAFRS